MYLPVLCLKMLWLETCITSTSILRKLWFQTECWTGESVEAEHPARACPCPYHLTAVPPFSAVSLCLLLLFIYLFIIFKYTVAVFRCTEGIRSHHGWLWATMWLLGFELRTFRRAVGALNHWAISPAPPPPVSFKSISPCHYHPRYTMTKFFFFLFFKDLFIFIYTSILWLSSDTPEEGIRSNYR